MPQSTSRNYRFALQVGLVAALLSLFGGCASTPDLSEPHATAGAAAKTLRYVETIDKVGMGSGDSFKKLLVGSDTYDIKRPVAVGLRHNAMIIADAGHNGLVLKYDFATGRLVPLRGVGELIADEASDVYIADDDSFYITDTLGKRVIHFAADGTPLRQFRSGPNISRPIAVYVDERDDSVYVADEVYSKVVQFDAKGEPVRGIGGRGVGEGKFRIITDMIKVPGGFLVSDRVELSVQLLDDSGNYQGHFGENDLMFPTALAADKYGRVFVAEKSDSTIKVFKNGEIIDVVGKNGYGKGEFRFISDMKIYDDKLYVVDSLNGRIQVFNILPENDKAQKVSMLQ